MSKKNKENKDKRKLAVRIMCIFLAFSMVASTILYILFYVLDYFKGLTV